MARELLWLNGTITTMEEGRLPVEDRATTFSDGIYEVCVFYNRRPFLLREHLERWEFSARGLELPMTGSIDERTAMLQHLVEESGFTDAMVYGQMSRGVSRRNHLFPPAGTPPTEFWFVRAAPRHAPENYASGVKLVRHADERWAQCQYKTICLLPNVLAKERAHRAGGYEALLVNTAGIVTECSASNAYCVRDGVVWTHPLAPCILGGITRMAILAAAREMGIPVREEPVPFDQFVRAQEVFITSTTMEVMPVTTIDTARVGDGKVGPVTRRLREALRERINTECGQQAASV